MSDSAGKNKIITRLVLKKNCLPTYPPLLWTAFTFLITDLYSISIMSVALCVWTGVLWLAYLAHLAVQKEVDIFENFRNQHFDKED